MALSMFMIPTKSLKERAEEGIVERFLKDSLFPIVLDEVVEWCKDFNRAFRLAQEAFRYRKSILELTDAGNDDFLEMYMELGICDDCHTLFAAINHEAVLRKNPRMQALIIFYRVVSQQVHKLCAKAGERKLYYPDVEGMACVQCAPAYKLIEMHSTRMTHLNMWLSPYNRKCASTHARQLADYLQWVDIPDGAL